MSLTNPETVVTEQRLADFYQGILPYLGANASFTVMSKFNKSDLYSTDEQLVGRWTDGKPLYQKVVDTGALPNASRQSTMHGISNIDMIVSVEGIAFYNGSFIPLPFVSTNGASGNNGFLIFLSSTKTTIEIETFSSAYTSYSGYAIIKYTKTTDVSVNIGSDTDYSETEKIVGTWVDGKPLYQKTIDCGVMPNSTTKTVAHNISNIASIVSLTGVAQNGDNVSGFIPLPLTMVGSSTTYQIYMKATYTDIVFKSDSNMSEFSKSYVTLQYTKTTD